MHIDAEIDQAGSDAVSMCEEVRRHSTGVGDHLAEVYQVLASYDEQARTNDVGQDPIDLQEGDCAPTDPWHSGMLALK
jgi:hypothetical protein